MAWELLTEVPLLLKEKQILHFSEGWGSDWADKWFRAVISHPMEYDVHRIVQAGTGNTQDLDFDKPSGGGVSATYLSLLPESEQTIYEILLGIKGLVFVYPRYNNTYFLKLETTKVIPDVTDADLKFLGFYDERWSPYYAPRLREYTVEDQTPPVLRLYNPMPDDERCVLRFIVNRLKVIQVDPADLSEQDKSRAREVKHYSDYIW